MLEDIVDKKSGFDLTSKSSFSNSEDSFTSRSYAAMLAKNDVPYSHKRVADNYIVIKRIYKFQAVQSRITPTEKELLAKYDFNTLEYTTAKQMNEELSLLQKWSASIDAELKQDADKIMEIRAKELKFIDANCYATISNEIYKGYVALSHYFEEISKFK
ncbi:MAG: hypothetical protein II085_02220 [Alphaproteobacteria bacterium]|nr:hypothetical protein [Alphaproteobacteria bacterium]